MVIFRNKTVMIPRENIMTGIVIFTVTAITRDST